MVVVWTGLYLVDYRMSYTTLYLLGLKQYMNESILRMFLQR